MWAQGSLLTNQYAEGYPGKVTTAAANTSTWSSNCIDRVKLIFGIVVEQPDDSLVHNSSQFGGLKCDCRALSAWLVEMNVELVVTDGAGIYWKFLYSHIERAGIAAWVVNARFVKHVPGRKTNMRYSQWLAVLARFGLGRGSFNPLQHVNELRMVSRYRRKLIAMHASEINRLHKTP